tara:strand:- start:1195 stop:1347 length:153 start_codon:yes stop_codon:yes gene_type:complete
MRMIQNPLTPPTTLELYSMAKDVAAISGRAFGDVLEDMVAVLDIRINNKD